MNDKPFFFDDRLDVCGQLFKLLAERDRLQARHKNTGIQFRNIENRGQQVFYRRQGSRNAGGEALIGGRLFGIGQFAKRKPGGVQRLQQIVTDSREEARLETIGTFGGVARAFQFFVGPLKVRECMLQFFGAGANLVFEADRRLKQ